MKIFIALSRIPYPLDKGDKLRAYHQIKELIAQHHQVTICCLHFGKAPQQCIQHLSNMGGEWHFIRLSPLLAVWRIISNIFKKTPFQVALFHSNMAQQKINSILQNTQPDHLLAQLVRTSEYFKMHVQYKKSIDYMDALGYGLERRAEHSRWPMKWMLQEESQRMYRYENVIWNYYDHHFIISKKDALKIRVPQPHRMIILANGIDTHYFKRSAKTLGDKIVFTGNMGYPPNVDAALFLIRQVMPLVWKINPHISVVIAGADPDTILLREKSSHITITGRVEDIRNYYDQAALFVAPMRMGTGMQNKILEAMSMEIPIITSDIAAEAFHPTLQNTMMVASEADSMATLILQSYLPGSNSHQNLRDCVAKEYNWNNIMKIFIDTINESD